MTSQQLEAKAKRLQALIGEKIVQAHGMIPMFVRASDYELPTAEDYRGAYRHRHLHGKTEEDIGIAPMHAWRAWENTATDTAYYLAAAAYKYRCTGDPRDLAVCRRTLGALRYIYSLPIEKGEKGLKVTSIRMELGEPDASGRRRPVAIPGSEFEVECDTVIMAIGQQVDLDCVKDMDLELSRWGTIVADEQTMQTSLPGVFAGGDAVTGPDIAVRAVGAGHVAALSIDQYLRENELVGRPAFWNSSSVNGRKRRKPTC